MSKKFALALLFVLVVSFIITACGSSLPVSAEKFLGSCPVSVRVNLYARTQRGGSWVGGNWMGHQLFEVGNNEFTSKGYNDTPKNLNSGVPNWRFDQLEWEKFDKYFVTDVEPPTSKFNANIAKVFGGLNTFEVGEFIQRRYTVANPFYPSVITWKNSCPDGGFKREIPLYIKEAPFEQTDVVNGKVYFRYTTSAGSVFNFWLPEKTFIAILMEGDMGQNPASMTTHEVEAYLFSGEITRWLMSEGAVEIGSYAIVPEDTQGRAEIYTLVQKILHYVSGDVTVLNTLSFDIEGKQNSKLLGTIIEFAP